MAASTTLIRKQEARVQDQIWKTDHVIYSAIIVQGTQTGKSNTFENALVWTGPWGA